MAQETIKQHPHMICINGFVLKLRKHVLEVHQSCSQCSPSHQNTQPEVANKHNSLVFAANEIVQYQLH